MFVANAPLAQNWNGRLPMSSLIAERGGNEEFGESEEVGKPRRCGAQQEGHAAAREFPVQQRKGSVISIHRPRSQSQHCQLQAKGKTGRVTISP